jgi:UDP-N-acetylmuramoyl-L-alanyl-D-glutamate--2,6-diaminopimelate ligase
MMARDIHLERLIARLKEPQLHDMRDVVISSVTNDSRKVEQGALFVATKGGQTDGHSFIEGALARGAAAVVSERRVPVRGKPNIVVDDSTRALAELASEFYGNPSRDLYVVGVTGTNGKTSTTHLLRSICDASTWGHVGVVGTVGHGVGRRLEESAHTTPEPVTLHRLFAGMKAQGCRGVVMEVSSHAVKQQRTWGVDFEIGMLTNITRDHLDYHPSFEDYVGAKREFCYSLAAPNRSKPEGTLVYSIDNDESRKIGEEFAGKKVSTSIEVPAGVFANNVQATIDGTRFTLNIEDGNAVEIELKLLGTFSVSNAVMAAAGAHILGINLNHIKKGLESVKRVPGRFEAIGGGSRPLVIIDYSHTPDSLELTLSFCLGLNPERLITVFGCGGDRDRGKRPLMGEIAQRLSHECYVTSDNPRSEDPQAIIDEILGGMDRDAKGLHVEVDRRRAIVRAIESAEPGDVVAICGKGHEDYQIIGSTRHHFDDREEAGKALETWKAR